MENKENRYFHVTPRKNLLSISDKGLMAQCGKRSSACAEGFPAVWLFPSVEQMEDALGGWLGEEFGDDETLVILQIDLPADFPIFRENVGRSESFEAYSKKNIPAAYVTGVFREDGEEVWRAA